MNKQLLFIILAGLISTSMAFGQSKETSIRGKITVDESLDSTGDYSGISLNIVSIGGERGVDTLFTAVTNIDGTFSGKARFNSKGEFTASISRYDIPLGAFAVILSDADPLTISAELPDIDGSLSISSNEHKAMDTYKRVESNYNRIVDFINSGAVEVTQDTIPVILNTWSDLFWSLRESHKGTLAADIGTLRSIEILGGYNDDKLIERVRQSIQDDSFYTAAKAKNGANALIRIESVDAALSFIDSVLEMNLSEDDRIALEMEQIEIKIDHGRENEAKEMLYAFKETYKNNDNLKEWVDVMVYDIEHVFPGLPVPEFSLQLHKGGRVQHSDLTGKVHLIEIVNFANTAYQTEHTLLGLMYEAYQDEGLEIVTIPIHDSRVTVNAFIEDKNVKWPVVSAGQFNSADIIQTFNLTVLPTRILVDTQGKIIRKYSGTNFAIIQNDIIKLLEEE